VVRGVLAVAAALLIAVAVVRNAVVAQFAEVRPRLAAAVWPEHPDAQLWSALTDIAAAARAGKPVDPKVLQSVNDAADKDPLAAEPFLVRGVRDHLAGNESLAAAAYEEAEDRDGRSVPARYFLADHFLRIGDGRDGLREAAMLARMVPNGIGALAPFVATYAKDPGNWAELGTMFASDPQLGNATLSTLAKDPRDSDLVLRLSTLQPRGTVQSWMDVLISSLVADGEFAKAHQVWRSTGQVNGAADALIYDPAFRDASAPGPFNWTLTSSALGLAERRPGGRLHVIYYAQDDGVLASQLLVLSPGRYRIAMQASGDLRNVGLLSWRLTCANSPKELFGLRLGASTQGSFDVPGGCAAQRLELMGSAPDLAQAVDVTISGLSLTRESSGG
ncbi:hypothetical protein, partial [Sphingomonas sp.]|uniref:hypothetical protein n=1 Tax=Sphingomonas sp. TaxID=28214 RepID=UPI0025F67059